MALLDQYRTRHTETAHTGGDSTILCTGLTVPTIGVTDTNYSNFYSLAVYVDGSEIDSADYTYTHSTKTVVLDAGVTPSSDYYVLVQRITDIQGRNIEFQSLGQLKSSSLNQDSDQSYDLAQEAFEIADKALSPRYFSTSEATTPGVYFDCQGVTLKNGGSAEDMNDLTTLQDVSDFVAGQGVVVVGLVDQSIDGIKTFIGTLAATGSTELADVTITDLTEHISANINVRDATSGVTIKQLSAGTDSLAIMSYQTPASYAPVHMATPTGGSASTQGATKGYVDSLLTTANTWTLAQTFSAAPVMDAGLTLSAAGIDIKVTNTASDEVTFLDAATGLIRQKLNIAEPIEVYHAASKNYVDNTISSSITSYNTSLLGGVNSWTGVNTHSAKDLFNAGLRATSNIDMYDNVSTTSVIRILTGGGFSLTNQAGSAFEHVSIAYPTADDHAATKLYVDNITGGATVTLDYMPYWTGSAYADSYFRRLDDNYYDIVGVGASPQLRFIGDTTYGGGNLNFKNGSGYDASIFMVGDYTGGSFLGQDTQNAFIMQNIDTGPVMIGTVAADALYLGTNDTLAITVDSSQNVGINTDSPEHTLDVSGSLRASGNSVDVTTGAGPALTYQSGIGYLNNYNYGTTAYEDMVIGNNSLDQLYLKGVSGYVGIGTSSPTSKLTIKGIDGSSILDVHRVGFVSAQWKFAMSESVAYTAYTGTSSGTWCNTIDSTNSNLMLSTAFAGGTGGNLILDCVSVGVDNTSPSSWSSNANQLVIGDATASTGMTITGISAGYATINFSKGLTDVDPYRGQIQYDFNTDSLKLGTAGAATGLTIDGSQNIGIGTPTPDTILHTIGSTSIKAEVVTSAQNSGVLACQLKTTSSLDMLDGFGPSIGFSIEDTAGVENFISYITAYREGGDDSGGLSFYTVYGGVSSESMRIASSGNVGIGVLNASRQLELKRTTGDADIKLNYNDSISMNLISNSSGNTISTDGASILRLQAGTGAGTGISIGTLTSHTVGFYGANQVAQQSAISSPTADVTSLKTAVDTIIGVLQNIGITA